MENRATRSPNRRERRAAGKYVRPKFETDQVVVDRDGQLRIERSVVEGKAKWEFERVGPVTEQRSDVRLRNNINHHVITGQSCWGDNISRALVANWPSTLFWCGLRNGH